MQRDGWDRDFDLSRNLLQSVSHVALREPLTDFDYTIRRFDVSRLNHKLSR
jgi:hypothetical protein